MKKWSSNLLVFLVISSMMVGCVSLKDYDAVLKERDDARIQVASLQSDLNKISSDFDNVKSDIKTITVWLKRGNKGLGNYSHLYDLYY